MLKYLHVFVIHPPGIEIRANIGCYLFASETRDIPIEHMERLFRPKNRKYSHVGIFPTEQLTAMQAAPLIVATPEQPEPPKETEDDTVISIEKVRKFTNGLRLLLDELDFSDADKDTLRALLTKYANQ